VIVATNEREALAEALHAWLRELGPGDELIVSDNASTDGSPELAAELAPSAVIVRNGENLGFGAAANLGAERATGDVLLLLNADVRPQPGFRDAILRPLADGRGWAAWMPLVTYERGALINTAGGVAHFSGISWAGRSGEPVAGAELGPREVAFVPGGAVAVLRREWVREGGFAEEFFMYCEDLDLSLRLRLRGARVGIEPAAVLDHDYEFRKARRKWLFLERNRYATVIRTYPAPLLAALAPALLVTELALYPVALAGGWLDMKLRASAQALAALPRLLRERRSIQSGRTVSVTEFAGALTPALDSAYLGPLARSRVLGGLLRAYWRGALRLAGAADRRTRT
jgi:GT2 family glycosyltransferase